MCLRPVGTVTFDLLTFKVVSESGVTWATPVEMLFFLGLSVLDLGPMYATDRQTSDVRQHHRLMPPPRGRGHNKLMLLLLLTMSQSHTHQSALGELGRASVIFVTKIKTRTRIIGRRFQRTRTRIIVIQKNKTK